MIARKVWRIFIAVCFCGVPFASAQTDLQTFTSRDGAFRVKYSRMLVRCTLERSQEGYSGSWVPPDACMSPEGVCDDTAASANTIACFAYPKERFREKPTFIAAAFFVSEIRGAATKETCLAGPEEWLTDSIGSTKINGVTFTLFSINDNWLGGGQTGQIYRAFHNGGCYELGIQQAFTRPGGSDSRTIQKFTKRDQAEVDRSLLQALHSFRFLK